MFDFHIHSKNSHDSKQTLDEICLSAIEKGVSGVAVCDHVDMWFFDRQNTMNAMTSCIAEVNAAKEKYKGKLRIFQGMELGEYYFDKARADEIMRLCEYDVILGSVHSLVYEDWNDSYSRIDFGETVSDEKILGFLDKYFDEMLDMVENTDIDVLCHLTCPLRYINGKYGRNIGVMPFEKKIRKVFEIIIDKEIALEINTSGMNTAFNSLMPDVELIKAYYEAGGRLITLGSDAHVPENIGNCFSQVKGILKSIGFENYYYYDKRVKQKIKL